MPCVTPECDGRHIAIEQVLNRRWSLTSDIRGISIFGRRRYVVMQVTFSRDTGHIREAMDDLGIVMKRWAGHRLSAPRRDPRSGVGESLRTTRNEWERQAVPKWTEQMIRIKSAKTWNARSCKRVGQVF